MLPRRQRNDRGEVPRGLLCRKSGSRIHELGPYGSVRGGEVTPVPTDPGSSSSVEEVRSPIRARKSRHPWVHTGPVQLARPGALKPSFRHHSSNRRAASPRPDRRRLALPDRRRVCGRSRQPGRLVARPAVRLEREPHRGGASPDMYLRPSRPRTCTASRPARSTISSRPWG
jgi:hypothetical protein